MPSHPLTHNELIELSQSCQSICPFVLTFLTCSARLYFSWLSHVQHKERQLVAGMRHADRCIQSSTCVNRAFHTIESAQETKNLNVAVKQNAELNTDHCEHWEEIECLSSLIFLTYGRLPVALHIQNEYIYIHIDARSSIAVLFIALNDKPQHKFRKTSLARFKVV